MAKFLVVIIVISVCGELFHFSNTKPHFNLLKHIAVRYHKDMGSGFIFCVPVSVLSIRTCKYRAEPTEHYTVSEEDNIIFKRTLETSHVSIRSA